MTDADIIQAAATAACIPQPVQPVGNAKSSGQPVAKKAKVAQKSTPKKSTQSATVKKAPKAKSYPK